MDKEYTAEEARALADKLEDGDLYVCSDETSSDQDDYGYYRRYYKEQWKASDDIVCILREYAKMKELNESENPFVIKSFKAACSFVNQLSDMYDEQNLRQLPPGLSSMLDQSIKILKDNLNTASWVSKTLEDAQYLRDNISTITCISNVI